MTASTTDGVAELVRKARNARAPMHEQQAAFTTLVERFEEMAFATAVQASEDLEEARDACQEAFLVAWRTLPNLREPAAFGGWLKRLVRTQCARARRRRRPSAEERTKDPAEVPENGSDPTELLSRHETLRSILHAVGGLPPEEREAITLFYFLGEPLRVVAQVLGVSDGNAGKHVYRARLRLRRCLPRSVAEAFLAVAPTPAFARRVQSGVFDEFVGEYRFANRPDHPVTIRREGDALVGYAGGQRNVLVSRKPDTMAPTEFDGEGRFRRDRRGRVSHFIYYEFGRRLGVAEKVQPARMSSADGRPSVALRRRSPA
jgi:RNA polymerase sigma-70 factor (ECF subfamily)